MCAIKDTIIDVPVDDSDYDYTRPPLSQEDIDTLTYDKRLAEADDAMISESEIEDEEKEDEDYWEQVENNSMLEL